MIYEYECKTCGIFEVQQKLSDPPIEKCKCGEEAVRIISQTNSHVGKKDWYSTDQGPRRYN